MLASSGACVLPFGSGFFALTAVLVLLPLSSVQNVVVVACARQPFQLAARAETNEACTGAAHRALSLHLQALPVRCHGDRCHFVNLGLILSSECHSALLRIALGGGSVCLCGEHHGAEQGRPRFRKGFSSQFHEVLRKYSLAMHGILQSLTPCGLELFAFLCLAFKFSAVVLHSAAWYRSSTFSLRGIWPRSGS